MWFNQISSELKNKIKKGPDRLPLEKNITRIEEVFFNNLDPAFKAQFFLIGLVLLNKLYNDFVLSDTPITRENFLPYFAIKDTIKIDNNELFFKNAQLSSFLDTIEKAQSPLNLASLKNQLAIINVPLENHLPPLEVSRVDFTGLKSFFAKETMPGTFESFFENALENLGKKESLDKFLQSVYELFKMKFKDTHKWTENETAFISVLNNIVKTQPDKASVSRPTFKLEIASYCYLYHNYFKNYREVKLNLQRIANKNSADFAQLSLVMSKINFSITEDLASDEKQFLNKMQTILKSTPRELKNNSVEIENVKRICLQIIDEAINYLQSKTAVNYHLFKGNAERIIQESKSSLMRAKFIDALTVLKEVHEKNKIKSTPEDFHRFLDKFLNQVAQLKTNHPRHDKISALENMANHLTEIRFSYQNKIVFYEKIKEIIIKDAWGNDLDGINNSFENLIETLLSFLMEESKITVNVNDKPIFSKEKNLLTGLQKFEEIIGKLQSKKTVANETPHQAYCLSLRLRVCIEKLLQYSNDEPVTQAMIILCQEAINQFKNLPGQSKESIHTELWEALEEVESALTLLGSDLNTSPKFFQKQRPFIGNSAPMKAESSARFG